MELYPHQKKAISNLGNGKVLYGGVGTGKSLTAVGYYMEKEAPKDIYVITTAGKRDKLDWDHAFVKFGVGTRSDATIAGTLKVDSWNNIGRYTTVEDAFFIFDEQKLVGTGSWVKSFLKISSRNNWIMLTATPGDTWLDYIPLFIANGLYRNRTEFLREHVIFDRYYKFPKVSRYRGEWLLEKYRNMLLVEMPYKSHTRRNVLNVDVDYDVEMLKILKEKRWNPFENKPIKDVGELFRLMRKTVICHPSRLDKTLEIFGRHKKVVIFYQNDYELKILRELADFTLVAEWNGHKHEPVPTEENEWVYLVQYRAGAEGWNCIETNAMIFFSLTYSYKTFEQAMGRIDRLNTPFIDLYYYILMSNSSVDRAVEKAVRNKKLFNERTWARENL